MIRVALLSLLSLSFAAGCASAPPPPPALPPAAAPAAAAPAETNDLPPALRELDLTAAQVEEVRTIGADLDLAGQPLAGAAIELGRSGAGAVRKCQGDSPFIESDAARVIRQGEEIRPAVLDAIARFHRLLTPAQRAKLSQRLIETDDWAKRERRNDQRTRALGPALDLSTMQIVSMLVKARVLWTSFADRAEPWRAHYRTAVTNFARADFDVRREPVSEAPVFAFFVDFVRSGLKFLVPILEPKQCEELARLIDEAIDERAAKAAERAEKAERVVREKRPR